MIQMDVVVGTHVGRFVSLPRRGSSASHRLLSFGHCQHRTGTRLWAPQPIDEPHRAGPVPSRHRSPTKSPAAATSAEAQPLTPRQRRLAQQRRKWEEAQQQQQQRTQSAQAQQSAQQSKPKLDSAQSGASAKIAPLPKAEEAALTEDPAPGTGPAASRHDARVGAQRPASGPATPTEGPDASQRRASPAMQQQGASVPREDGGAAAPPSPGSGAPVSAAGRGSVHPPRPQPRQQSSQQQHPLQQQSELGGARWPSLFAAAAAGPRARSSLDPHDQSTQDLVSLAHQWTEELVHWEAAGTTTADAAAGVATRAGSVVPGPAHAGPQASDLPQLPAAAAARLARLTSAVNVQVTRGSLGHQELADLAWCVGHYDRDHSLRALYAALQVPFRVVPRFLPGLRLQDFESEVELARDTIYLDDGTRAVAESRLTGWQSEIGATFKYSGKEMQPQAGGLSPNILKVRDALLDLTGVKYDSVLINYYEDGKCGMRYHVDPLYDRWTPNSAVVSLGDTRTFIFRAVRDHSIRWQYRVRNGDVVLMFDDCQERLQHCVRVERRAEDAGPRMSLVFKERLRGPTGQYLLP